MKFRFTYLFIVTLLATVVVYCGSLFAPVIDIEMSNLASEASVTLIVLIAVLLINNSATYNSKQLFVNVGLSLLFLSLLADTMDEIRAVSELYSLIFEDVVEFLGYLILLIGIICWLRLESSNKSNLQHLATTDALTGALNRRAFSDFLARELSRSERFHHSLSLVLLDIDNFKQLNDEYGHLFGDYVLKEFCRIIHSEIRSSDVFCRWGGEEFVILLPETEGKDAFCIIEKLRQLISASMFSTDEHSATITFSAGIAEYPQKRDVDALLKAADLCLYEAKSNSRNKTVWLRTG